MCLVASSILSSVNARGQAIYTEYNKAIAHLGVQGPSVYVQFVGGVSQPCPDLYMSDPASMKLLYAQLLSAKLTGRSISRVDYAVLQSGTCVINLVQIDQ